LFTLRGVKQGRISGVARAGVNAVVALLIKC
jgi:hypothetical protein